MTLSELLKDIAPLQVRGEVERDICGVAIDSRQVRPGYLFIALRGTQVDGHQFIPKALEQGAAAVVCETLDADGPTADAGAPHAPATFIQVASSEQAAGPLAHAFYGRPSQRLALVGVTGTNGKTTIATLLYHLFRKLGYRCGLLSTVCNYIEGEPVAATHTTPDPVELNQLLARMVEAGCQYAFMECSSHAIAQQRIGGLRFRGGIFTNLTRDHLDYHKTVEAYRDAKKAFFDHLPKEAFALTNLDDKNGLFMTQNTRAQVKTYSQRQMADFRARVVEAHFEGMYLDICGREVGVQFIGRFNVSNLLAVYGAAVLLGQHEEDVLVALSTLHSVNGRLEPIQSPEGFTVIVDYAHTPDALANVLAAIHEVRGDRGQVITVCGAGGNRDKGKRPLMAQEAVRQSDRVIITSDNPRFEEPADIIRDMLEGLSPQQRKKVITIEDRREAIRAACMMAQRGDVVLVAGKGHEDYQEVKGVKHHFDDHEVIREALMQNDQMV